MFFCIFLLQLKMGIEEYKGRWPEKASSLTASLLGELRNIGAFESIGSSNRIEDNTLTDKEVESFLQGLSTKSFRSRNEEEVAGYSEVLNAIYSSYDSRFLS